MKKLFIIFGILILVMLLSCVNSNFKVKVTVNNVSGIVFDSVRIYVYPDRDTTFYNVKTNETVVKVFEYKNFSYLRGEQYASGIAAYKDDYYYGISNGLIDSPYALLEDAYTFYIWDNGIHPVKGVKPEGYFSTKHTIQKMKK